MLVSQLRVSLHHEPSIVQIRGVDVGAREHRASYLRTASIAAHACCEYRLAPPSTLRAAIIPTPRQQGVEEPEASSAAPHWSWARLLKRVFALDLATCPFCH
jgi:hypothetical protein